MVKDIHGGNVWKEYLSSEGSCKKIIDFSASINPSGLSPGAKKALRASFRLLPHYPDPDSILLKDALSEYLGVPAGSILPANGSTELIYALPMALKPAEALIIEPAFSEYGRSLEASGVRVKTLVLSEKNSFSLDFNVLRQSLKKCCGLVYLANPANPTGRVYGKDEMIEVSRECKKTGSILVLDEAFIDFAEEESLKAIAARSKGLVIMRSLTKFFSMAGLRIGYAVGAREILRKISETLPPWSVNTAASFAAIGALSDGRFIDKTNKWVVREREFLQGRLSGIKGIKVYPSGANYLMCKILSRGSDSKKLCEELKKSGLLIRSLAGFRGLGARFFRISVRGRADNKLVVEQIRAFMKSDTNVSCRTRMSDLSVRRGEIRK